MAWRRELGRRKTWWVPAGMESHEQAGVEEHADEQLRAYDGAATWAANERGRARGNGGRRAGELGPASRSTPAAMWRAAGVDLTGGDVVSSRSRVQRRQELAALERLGVDLGSSLDKVMPRALRFVLPDVKRSGWSHDCMRTTRSYQIFFPLWPGGWTN